MDYLVFTLNAILPIIIPVMVGFFLKKINLLSQEFWGNLNKLVFKLMIPVLLFSNLYLADLSTINWAFVGFGAGSILVLFGIGLLVVMAFKDRKQKGVILQATFRSNYAIIGIPLAVLLGGDKAQASAAVMAAVSVPIFNILAVIALSIYDHEEGQKIDVKDILKKIVTNPLIIGVVAGLLVCLLGLGIDKLTGIEGTLKSIFTDYTVRYDVIDGAAVAVSDNSLYHLADLHFVGTAISYIGRCATPVALLVLGARFEFSAVKKLWRQLTVTVSFRLIITPVVFLTIAYFLGKQLGWGTTEYAILVALFATPIAVSSAPMAAQMGQDEELAGQIVVWTTALSAFTLFLIIFTLAAIGML